MTDTITRIKPQITELHLPINYHLQHFFKRSFDIVASVLGLIFLSPVFGLLAFLIQHESPGPVFYRGSRAGKDGKPFGILKFRTMYECPTSYQGPRVTARGDRRITPLGKWLRETKINELPQLWNVLVREMSMVGPRPEDVEIAKTWPPEIRREILSVRPGITSPTSILYRDEEKMLDSKDVMDHYLSIVLPEKLRLDQLYVRNRSFLADLDVIFWTLIVLLPTLRTTPIPTEAVYNGLLHRLTSRYLSWFVMDNVIAFAAVGLTGVLWRMSGPLELGMKNALVLAAAMALIFSLVNSWLGLGRVLWRSAPPALVFDLAFSSGISTLLVAIIGWLWPHGQLLPLGMVFVSGLLAFLGFTAVRYRERLLTGLANRWLGVRKARSGLVEHVLIVGAGECGILATWLLQRSNLSHAYAVVGMVDDDPTKQGMTVDGHKVFGLTRRIPEIVKREDVGLILFAIESIRPEEQEHILKLCRQTSARLVMIPDLMAVFRERLSSVAPIFPLVAQRG